MIARKLLWIVEICWGTASNFHHLQSKTFNLFFLVFSFCLCSFFPANCCALNDPAKLIQICEGSSIFFPSLAMFIQDCTKRSYLIELYKELNCVIVCSTYLWCLQFMKTSKCDHIIVTIATITFYDLFWLWSLDAFEAFILRIFC